MGDCTLGTLIYHGQLTRRSSANIMKPLKIATTSNSEGIATLFHDY